MEPEALTGKNRKGVKTKAPQKYLQTNEGDLTLTNPWPTHVENTCKKKQLKHAKPYKTFHEILVGFRLNTIVNYLGSIIPYINSKASLFVTYIHNLDLNPLSWCHETVPRTLKMGTIRTSELLLPGGHIKSLGCLESYHFPKTSS